MPVLEASPPPSSIIPVKLRADHNGEEIVLATHTDSIQAMLLTADRYPEAGIMVKGRLGAVEERRIVQDSLYRVFTKSRAERAAALRRRMGEVGCSGEPYLSVEQSEAGEPFECGFFRLNKLVTGLFAGELNANTLMVQFGGATELEIGSNVCDEAELAPYADKMAFEIRARQMGELPMSILMGKFRQGEAN